MSIFQLLLNFDDQLVDWILHASPSNDVEREAMRRVLALRGELEDDLNKLVAFRLKASVAALPDQAARLTSLASAMQATEQTVENAAKVISTAGEVVSIAAKVLAFALA